MTMERSLEIDRARETKDFAKALEIISELPSEELEALEVKKSVVKVYLDQMELAMNTFSVFYEYLQKVVALGVPSSEVVVWKTLMRKVTRFFNTPMEGHTTSKRNEIRLIFDQVSLLPLRQHEDLVTSFVKTVLKLQKKNPTLFLIQVLDWWEDMGIAKEAYLQDDNSSRCLVERFYQSCSKALLMSSEVTKELGYSWTDRLCKQLDHSPRFMSLAISLFQIYQKQDRLKEGVENQKRFVRKNIGLYWGWELLANYHQKLDHSETVLACLCRAYNCSMSRTTKWNIGAQIAEVISIHSGDNVASWMSYVLLQDVPSSIATSRLNRLEVIRETALPCSSVVAKEVINQWASDADRWLWSDYPSYVGIVSWVDFKSKVIGLIYGVNQRVVFPMNKAPFKVKVGDWLRAILIENPKKNPELCYVEASKTLPPGSIFKTVSGRVQQKIGESFGFVYDCFIPPHMMSKFKLEQGMYVELSLVYDMDPRMNKMVWKVVTVEKIDRQR
ncbi:MAG: DUF7017 domain-containing protein [Prolixibacteraceae bacterium]